MRLKELFDRNVKPSAQILDNLLEREEIRESSDMVEFVRLAEKYRHHDAEECPARACLVCEGIGWIVNGQSDIADAHYARNYDHALDNGMVF